MNTSKKYESSYAGYVYEKPVTYWTSKETVMNSLTKIDLSSSDSITSGGMPIISNENTVYADANDNHTAVIASSGMKKSVCCFLPLIISKQYMTCRLFKYILTYFIYQRSIFLFIFLIIIVYKYL